VEKFLFRVDFLGGVYEIIFCKLTYYNNQNQNIMKSKTILYTLLVVILIAGGFYVVEKQKESDEKWKEKFARLEKAKIENARKEKIEFAYKYSNECRLNKECWINVFETLKKGMDKDLSDGVVDEDWSRVKFEIFDNLNAIVNEKFKVSVLDVFYDYPRFFLNYSSGTAMYKTKYGEILF